MAYHAHEAAAAERGTYGKNASSILRHRRVAITRNHIPHKSSPYVGWFRHAPAMSSRDGRQRRFIGVKPWTANVRSLPTIHREKSSPYVGWFRHAPPSNLYEKKNGRIGGEARSSVNRGEFCRSNEDDIDLKLKMLRKQCIGGRLPGGGPAHRRVDHTGSASDIASVGAVGKKQNNNNSPFFSSREATLMTSSILTKYANWFLFPLANDERTSFLMKENIGGETVVECIANRVVKLLPYLSSTLKRIFFLDDGASTLFLEAAGVSKVLSKQHSTNSLCSCDNHSESDLSEYSDYDSPHVYNTVTDVGDSDTDNIKNDPDIEFALPIEMDANSYHISVSSLAEAYYAEQARQVVVEPNSSSHPLASLSFEENRCVDSISQIDITRMARNASRHLDVESILKLPSITYETTKRSDEHSFSTENGTTDQDCTSEAILFPSAIEEEDANMGWSWISTPTNLDDDRIPTTKSADNGQIDAKEESTNVEEVLDEKCVICLEQFVDGDRLRVLPCGHSFHMGCIDKWLSGSLSHNECFTSGCPTCKKTPNIIDSSEVEARDSESMLEAISDDSVPSWAFANLGGSLAMEI